MSKHGAKFWYRVKLLDSVRLTYIVYAANADDAKESFQGCSERCLVTRMTWEGLSALTGCVIPPAQYPHRPAVGDLMFERKDKFFIVRVQE